jgi:pimeloyl-ACP methyl ester carboxylesterase
MRPVPVLERGDLRLHYEETGTGFPLLLFAPGGMRSSIPIWEKAPWNPIAELARAFRIIAMDQRNAGRSAAEISAADGWHSYASDHLRLLDHLGIDRCHVLGGCIGGSYCLGLMQAAPDRVQAGVLQQPIGCSGSNREVFYAMFDNWANELRAQRPEVTPEAWEAFRQRMYGGDFVFNVSRDFVRSCRVPMLVLMGNDVYHPSETSREIARLAPNAELVERWKDPDVVADTPRRVLEFLRAHTPAS